MILVLRAMNSIFFQEAKDAKNWNQIQRFMSNADKFIMELRGYDKDNMPRFAYESLRKNYFTDERFNYERICKTSKAAAGLFLWIRGLYNYVRIIKQRGPQMTQSPVRQQHVRNSSELGYSESPLRQPRPQPSHLNSTASRNAKTQRA